MPFLQLTLDIGRAEPEPFEEALFAAGALSVTLQDAADDPVLEPAPGTTPLWPTVTIKALFDIDSNPENIVSALQKQCGLPRHRFEHIEDRAWEREWLKDFKPMRFGERLWICPGGLDLPAEFRITMQTPRSQPIVVALDPGLAFGTGTHATTALCLEWLDGAHLTHRTVIDYGCGSGILAIAALKLGAQSAVGIDIDPQALIASRDNAERNRVSDRLHLQLAQEPLPAPADIVLANILAEPLVELAPTLASLVKPGGAIVLSGILESQMAQVIQRYLAWFDIELPVARSDWVRLTGKRR